MLATASAEKGASFPPAIAHRCWMYGPTSSTPREEIAMRRAIRCLNWHKGWPFSMSSSSHCPTSATCRSFSLGDSKFPSRRISSSTSRLSLWASSTIRADILPVRWASHRKFCSCAVQHVVELALPHQRDLQKFLVGGLEIPKQANFLKHIETQLMGLIDDQGR